MDIEEVLTELLGERRTGDLEQDLLLAGREVQARRERNTLLGGIVIANLRDQGLSYRDIERETGISKSNAARWAQPPDS